MINVAVVGIGYWGPNLVRNLYKIPDVKQITVCDLSIKNLQNIASAYPSVKTTTDYIALLKDDRIDAIVIATPVSTHFDLAKKALIAKKHVLLEKPMTRTSQQAEELITIAKKNNRVLMVGYTFIYNNAIQKIKELLKKKSLGNVFYYDSTRINLGLIQPDINVIWDLAPHDLSILNFLFPEKPISLHAFGTSYVNGEREEVAHLIIKYENNISAHIHNSWLSPIKMRTILIGGNKKMIQYNELEPSEKIKIYDNSVSVNSSKEIPFESLYRYGDVVIPHLEQKEALFTELSHFIYCIENKKKPLSDGTEGLKIIKLLEASDKSLQTRSEVYFTDK